MKYVLDAWGLEKFMAAVEKEHGKPFTRLPLTACAPRQPGAKHGHIGVHPQRRDGFSYVGISVPVGRLSVAQLKGLGALAARYAGATLRLTVWQNLILSDVPNDRLGEVETALVALGLGAAASAIRGALVACTGNTGCKFAATNTKGQALLLAEHLDRRIALDRPVNIHLTGCPNSCAQHKVSDIGLLGIKVGDDMIEGYTILVGGGAGPEQKIGREIFSAVPMAEMPERVEALLRVYLAHRRADESFHDFAARHSVEELKALAVRQPEMAA
jgi:ferredoxin-nitrite reductase